MSQPTPRRRGGFSSLLVVGVIALVLWFWFARPQAAPESAATPSAATNATLDNMLAMSTAVAAQTAPTATITDAISTGAAPAETTAPTEVPTNTPKPTQPTATPTRGPPAQIDGLPIITLDELPPEALETLALIESDGPFPFSKDGTTFQNREQLLPRKPSGYYREYTVITPGENDRGARRVVGGEAGELYYTDDHYESFAVIWTP